MNRKLGSLVVIISFLFALPLALMYPAAAPALAAGKSGDIWVADSEYIIWHSEDLNSDGRIDAEDYNLYMTRHGTTVKVIPFGEDLPITVDEGTSIVNIYVLDGNPLIIGGVSLQGGGITGSGDLNIASGAITADFIKAGGDLQIAPGCDLDISRDVTVAGHLDCYGGRLTIGGNIAAESIWFDSADAPLFVKIGGDVTASYFTQSGGDVTVYGSVIVNPMPKSGSTTDDARVVVNSDYARHNETTLTVYGQIGGSAGSFHTIISRSGDGRNYDEAALAGFIYIRSPLKYRKIGGYGPGAESFIEG